MTKENVNLSLEQLARYLAEKQNLTKQYMGVNYKHAISISKNLAFFQDSESLYARMRTFSSSLIHSLIKNKLIVQAPFIEKKLTYVSKDLLPFFYFSNIKDNIEYKMPETRSVLEFIKEQYITTRQKIVSRFGLQRETIMEILAELRENYQIFMYYDGSRWTINDSESLLHKGTMSRSTAITELVFQIIKSFGPITVPQVMKVLNLSGGRVSTSLIDLYETERVIRGYFIENSSYEAFIATDELAHLEQYIELYETKENVEFQLLPANDPLVRYWSSADFAVMDDTRRILIMISGLPICSFDYKVINDNLHVQNLLKTSQYSYYEEEIIKKVKEFAENQGKILVFPKTQSEALENQAKLFYEQLKKRSFTSRGSELTTSLSHIKVPQDTSKRISWIDVFPFIHDLQYLNRKSEFKTKQELIRGIRNIGVPLPINSLKVRTSRGKENIITDLQISKQIAIGKFGGFSRGLILASDYILYSRLRATKSIGVFEEKALNFIQQKGKVNFKQLREGLRLSDRVILATLSRLEGANEVIQGKTSSNQIVWYPVSDYLKNTQVKSISSQRDAWLEVIHRILSTNLPLSIRQIANITGLSNTQVEIYLRELIASKGVRSGRFIEENDTQYTTKEIEESLIGFLYKKESEVPEIEGNEVPEIEESEIIYLPRADPLLVLYRSFVLQKFKTRILFQRSLPSEYGELMLINGLPFAAVHMKKVEGIEYINNIELLAGYEDNHTLMLMLTAINDFYNKTKKNGEKTIQIKQINGVHLKSNGARHIIALMDDMKIDYHIIP